MRVKIGLYTPEGKVLGYKADTFWTLVSNPQEAKQHSLDNGEIPAHILRNLQFLLMGTREIPSDSPSVQFLRRILNLSRTQLPTSLEFLVGWSNVEGGEVTFTHRVDRELRLVSLTTGRGVEDDLQAVERST